MSGKKILILLGHPDSTSFNAALADAYKKGALASGAEVREIKMGELNFDLSLKSGYRERMELEADLRDAQEKILWADHLVWVYPVWWGSVPAVMKGFLDRVLLPGFAFQKRENSVWWDKLLAGKSARLICTMDQPPWYYRFINHAPTHFMMKKMVMQFCGVQQVGITSFGVIRNSPAQKRMDWLLKTEELGRKNK